MFAGYGDYAGFCRLGFSPLFTPPLRTNAAFFIKFNQKGQATNQDPSSQVHIHHELTLRDPPSPLLFRFLSKPQIFFKIFFFKTTSKSTSKGRSKRTGQPL